MEPPHVAAEGVLVSEDLPAHLAVDEAGLVAVHVADVAGQRVPGQLLEAEGAGLLLGHVAIAAAAAAAATTTTTTTAAAAAVAALERSLMLLRLRKTCGHKATCKKTKQNENIYEPRKKECDINQARSRYLETK